MKRYFLFASLLTFFASCRNNEHKVTIKDPVITEVSSQTPPPPPPPRGNPKKMLTEKTLEDYISTAGNVVPTKTALAPFNGLDYDKIIAYDYKGGKPYLSAIDANGKFVPVINKQKFLTQAQADQITRLISEPATYGGGKAACFNPHLGLVFYKKNKIVHKIDICLDCNYLSTDINILPEKKDRQSPSFGFSQKGKKGIQYLCKQLGFYYGEQ